MSVDVLLQKADAMFPEGVGACRPFTKTGTAARKTNELLENASRAIEALWKQRGYSPKKPDDMEAQRERGPTPLQPPLGVQALRHLRRVELRCAV